MRCIGWIDRETVGGRRAQVRALVVAGIAASLLGAVPPSAPAAGFITATGCPHHQAFIEGDDDAVSAFLPEGYAPVRTSSGAPLLFVRAIRCDALGVDGKTEPGIMATYGVVIETPDGRGCASASPFGSLRGDFPPICNWYLLGWLANDRRVVEWLRRGTPEVPAAYVPGLEFELGAFDPAQGGAPFSFRAPAPAPSPFTIEAIGRERPGELSVRGGYWVDTPDGTVKMAFSTDDLTSGDANGVVTAAPGSPLAELMGAGQRSYEPEFSSLTAERWHSASYRKQNLAPAPGADRFDGSCSFQGDVRFSPPATNTESRDLVYDWDGAGTCTGALNGREITDAPASARQTGPAHATCGEARTTAPGQGAITFPGGEVIRSTLDFTSRETEVDLEYYGERSGFAGGHATFLTDRTPPDVVQRCGSTEGVDETPLDVTLTTESPLVSEPPPRLELSVVPSEVRRGHRRTFRFFVTTSDGRAVRRAVIKFAGRRARTRRTGRAKIVAKLKRARRYRARTTKRGFRAARATVVVR
jgi:hypothetical protein